MTAITDACDLHEEKNIKIHMPVQIRATPHRFSESTALLSDCHGRIEMFLGTLEKVAAQVDKPLTDVHSSRTRDGSALLSRGGPKHTADEEQSVFPRLRQCQATIAAEMSARRT